MFGVHDAVSGERKERWRRFAGHFGVEVRRGEGWVAILLFLSFFLFISFQYVTKSFRQSTFIDSLGAKQLPYVYLAVAILSYPVIVLYSRLVDRVSRYQLLAGTCGAIIVSLGAFWWAYRYPSHWVPVVFYVWASIVYVLTVSQFWNVANHVLDPRQAKRLFGFVGAGGLLGGLVGGQVARGATILFGTRHTLLVAAFIVCVTMTLVLVIPRVLGGAPVARPALRSTRFAHRTASGFRAFMSSRHLQLIGALLLLTVLVAQVVDLQFNWVVEQVTTSLDERNVFFGNFYTIMGASALLFQLVFTSRIHRFLGIGFGIRVLPLTMTLGTVTLLLAAGFFPALLIAAALTLKVGENGLRYSLDQATRELLFLPVPSRVRLKAKAYVDVFVRRAAKGLAALLLLPVTFGAISVVGAGWISLALIAGWLTVTVVVVRSYRREFRRQLKRSTVDTLEPIDLSDLHALELVVESMASTDSRRIVHGMELLSDHGRGSLVPSAFLEHPDAQVRLAALSVFERLGNHDVVPQIVRLIRDEAPEIRARAIRVLTSWREGAPRDVALRLDDESPEVQAAAGVFLAEAHGAEEPQATALLNRMVRSPKTAERVAAAKSFGTTGDPLHDGEVLRLLHDADPQVLRATIAAVRRFHERHGYNPIFVPRLVSLLRDRRFKREARDALVASGKPVIPTLVHFMFDPGETSAVRRALPQTIARIGGTRAWDALLDALRLSDDPFLRRNVIRALAWGDATVTVSSTRNRIANEMRFEARAYLDDLASLSALGLERLGTVQSGGVRWHPEQRPSLLHRLLAEGMQEHEENVFSLLGLLHPAPEVRAAHVGLKSNAAGSQAQALEYLDVSLDRHLKTSVFAVVGRSSTYDKLRKARAKFDIPSRTPAEVLGLLLDGRGNSGQDHSLTAAAAHYVHTNRIEEFRPKLSDLYAEADSGLVRETSRIALQRWNSRASSRTIEESSIAGRVVR